ncbi:MAG TPA: Gfo/Idh/MocA family oxidoreductase [Bacteroidales bacterium]|nr:Gfo/Idh/MocA family oxidoreductase [Bacteroidales bacterium]HQG63281.1 Gfo/Idh/MocA family oxidoreductase [Bacteroidales bacterium]HQK68534.1 Gfo/Idh/MocA family oxidoreductase [Bacteroidales bacterium]
MEKKKINRRNFISRYASAALAFTIIPRHVLGGPGFMPPSDQLTKGIIGVGGMGLSHFDYEGTKLLAVCDVDRNHLKSAIEKAGGNIDGYHDFRELIARDDIDIIHIATPPHWHGIISKTAAEAGKDIWCEKPMTRTIGEGIKVVEAIRRTGSMFRLNTWFRFSDQFYGMETTVKPLKKIVDSGILGWPLKVTVSGITGFDWKFYWSGLHQLQPMPVPEELDYDLWLGPAPFKPYNPERVHSKFRGYWDYDGGGLGDMGQHYLDPVQYLLGKDNTSPVYVEIDAPQQHYDAVGSWKRITYTYEDGCTVILDGENSDKDAAYLAGPYGKIYKGFRSDIKGFDKILNSLPDPEPQLTSFSESVRTRRKFALNEINGHRSCTLVNLGVIAVRLGRNLKYDPVNERFIDDEGANRLIDQPMRDPWRI